METKKSRNWTNSRRKWQSEVARRSTRKRERRIKNDLSLKLQRIKSKAEGKDNEFVNFRIRLGMYHEELAAVLKVNPDTVANWESGRSFPRSSARRELDVLARKRKVQPINWSNT